MFSLVVFSQRTVPPRSALAHRLTIRRKSRWRSFLPRFWWSVLIKPARKRQPNRFLGFESWSEAQEVFQAAWVLAKFFWKRRRLLR